MKEQRQFAIQSLVATLVLNAALLAALYMMGGASGASQLPLFLGLGAGLTLVLWLLVLAIGRRLIRQAAATIMPTRAPPKAKKETAAPSAPPPNPELADSAAVQMLSILQRKGRLIDFLQEDIRAYPDAQIGAAVRNVHEGCREALAEYVTLEPVFQETEGSPVTVPAGFDAKAIRLIGNVSGQPPFRGTLRHRGWRVSRIALPERVGPTSDEKVVAAAEVEIAN